MSKEEGDDWPLWNERMEQTVLFQGTPLQFRAHVSAIAGDLPPFQGDIRIAVDDTKPADRDPDLQRVTLSGGRRESREGWRYLVSVDVIALAVGDFSTVSLRCLTREWSMIEPGWKWLIEELTRMGRIPAPAQEAEGEASDAPHSPNKRGTSRATEANAREAHRLYYEDKLTQAVIAERLSVTERTVKRYLKRTRK